MEAACRMVANGFPKEALQLYQMIPKRDVNEYRNKGVDNGSFLLRAMARNDYVSNRYIAHFMYVCMWAVWRSSRASDWESRGTWFESGSLHCHLSHHPLRGELYLPAYRRIYRLKFL